MSREDGEAPAPAGAGVPYWTEGAANRARAEAVLRSINRVKQRKTESEHVGQ